MTKKIMDENRRAQLTRTSSEDKQIKMVMERARLKNKMLAKAAMTKGVKK